MQLPQHLIHTVFQIFHMENQNIQLLVLQLSKIISGSKQLVSKFALSMLILGQKACFLGPTTFEIPQPNWHYCAPAAPCAACWYSKYTLVEKTQTIEYFFTIQVYNSLFLCQPNWFIYLSITRLPIDDYMYIFLFNLALVNPLLLYIIFSERW